MKAIDDDNRRGWCPECGSFVRVLHTGCCAVCASRCEYIGKALKSTS